MHVTKVNPDMWFLSTSPAHLQFHAPTAILWLKNMIANEFLIYFQNYSSTLPTSSTYEIHSESSTSFRERKWNWSSKITGCPTLHLILYEWNSVASFKLKQANEAKNDYECRGCVFHFCSPTPHWTSSSPLQSEPKWSKLGVWLSVLWWSQDCSMWWGVTWAACLKAQVKLDACDHSGFKRV